MSEKVVEVIIGAQVRVSRHGLEGGGFFKTLGFEDPRLGWRDFIVTEECFRGLIEAWVKSEGVSGGGKS